MNLFVPEWGGLMNKLLWIAGIAYFGFTGSLSAQTCNCPTGTGSRVNIAQLNNLLQGNTVCVSNGAGGWDAQEQHFAGNVLKDYKLGPSSAIDPTEQVGTWSTSNNGSLGAQVIYVYGNQSYTYGVCHNGGAPATGQSLGFCPMGSGTATSATLKLGTTSGC